MPDLLRRVVQPFIHPIATGPRHGGHVLAVPSDLPYRRLDVVLGPGAPGVLGTGATARLPAERRGRTLVLPAGVTPTELGRREEIVEAVYVSGPADDEEHARSATRLGWRPVTAERWREPEAGVSVFPTVTVVVVTLDNCTLCEACLRALRRNTPWPALEIVIVDNGSTDGTALFLEGERERDPALVVIRNADNRGFAAAVNQGLAVAQGEYIALLNDDTVVGPGWLSRLVAQLEADPELGLVGPVTNEIGNEAKIPAAYASFQEMEAFALARGLERQGQRRAVPMLALFCAVIRRSTLQAAGGLDERYEVGLFEDDDLALSLQKAGKTLAIAEDAFVHHVGRAAFSRLTDSAYLTIWAANRRRFEEKWGLTWRPPEPGPP